MNRPLDQKELRVLSDALSFFYLCVEDVTDSSGDQMYFFGEFGWEPDEWRAFKSALTKIGIIDKVCTRL